MSCARKSVRSNNNWRKPLRTTPARRPSSPRRAVSCKARRRPCRNRRRRPRVFRTTSSRPWPSSRRQRANWRRRKRSSRLSFFGQEKKPGRYRSGFFIMYRGRGLELDVFRLQRVAALFITHHHLALRLGCMVEDFLARLEGDGRIGLDIVDGEGTGRLVDLGHVTYVFVLAGAVAGPGTAREGESRTHQQNRYGFFH